MVILPGKLGHHEKMHFIRTITQRKCDISTEHSSSELKGYQK